jgi:hypothetical protein
MARIWLIALGAAFLFVHAAGAKDWQGVMLPHQPTQFIFRYGSLIDSASRNSTVTLYRWHEAFAATSV